MECANAALENVRSERIQSRNRRSSCASCSAASTEPEFHRGFEPQGHSNAYLESQLYRRLQLRPLGAAILLPARVESSNSPALLTRVWMDIGRTVTTAPFVKGGISRHLATRLLKISRVHGCQTGAQTKHIFYPWWWSD